MSVQCWYSQDQIAGARAQTLGGIAALTRLPGYSNFRAAVAYATLYGCEVLIRELKKSADWRSSKKRWLISIDFGRTEPNALDFLASFSRTEVRIPNGLAALSNSRFTPDVLFHPKTYCVDDFQSGAGSTFGIFVGSGNLTASGLLTGCENGALCYWVNPPLSEREAMIRAHEQMQWFERIWNRADSLSVVHKHYKKQWKIKKSPIAEEKPDLAKLYLGEPQNVVSGDLGLALATAKALWVETNGGVVPNRGANNPGNQIDLKRGCRVFFGFAPTSVPKGTKFGDVMLQNIGYQAVPCAMHFHSNGMDRLNLPIPGENGPATYNHSVILIETKGVGSGGIRRFLVRVGDQRSLEIWKRKATAFKDDEMKGGRKYGLLF